MKAVFVPSKGRHFNANLLSVYGSLSPTIVVEPQDERNYRAAFPSFQLLVLPVNNGGIAFVRNFILERARSLSVEWFWMIDDDVTSFSSQVDGKNVKQPAEVVLVAAQKIIEIARRSPKGRWNISSSLGLLKRTSLKAVTVMFV